MGRDELMNIRLRVFIPLAAAYSARSNLLQAKNPRPYDSTITT